jgi:cupin fold WbuC family metalloprotein
MNLPQNLPRAAGPVFALDAAMLARGTRAAAESPRGRIMMKVHRSDTEGVQRLLNFMQRGSYAQPHRHPGLEAVETIAVVQGAVGFFAFEADGAVAVARRLAAGDPGSCLVDIEQGVWHTVVPLVDGTVVLEIKRGPYDAATDKIFAAWAPAEGSAEAAGYLCQLEAHFAA